MACVNVEYQARETTFLAALDNVTAFRIEGDVLYLYAGSRLVAKLRGT